MKRRRCTFCGLAGVDSSSRDAAGVLHRHHAACRALFGRWLAGEPIMDAHYRRAGRRAARECGVEVK